MLDTHFKWFKDTQADYLNIKYFSLSEVDDLTGLTTINHRLNIIVWLVVMM